MARAKVGASSTTVPGGSGSWRRRSSCRSRSRSISDGAWPTRTEGGLRSMVLARLSSSASRRSPPSPGGHAPAAIRATLIPPRASSTPPRRRLPRQMHDRDDDDGKQQQSESLDQPPQAEVAPPPWETPLGRLAAAASHLLILIERGETAILDSRKRLNQNIVAAALRRQARREESLHRAPSNRTPSR